MAGDVSSQHGTYWDRFQGSSTFVSLNAKLESKEEEEEDTETIGEEPSSVRIELGASFDTFRRRWTVPLHWISFSGEVSGGEKMTDPESYITEYTLVYDDKEEPIFSRTATRDCKTPHFEHYIQAFCRALGAISSHD